MILKCNLKWNSIKNLILFNYLFSSFWLEQWGNESFLKSNLVILVRKLQYERHHYKNIQLICKRKNLTSFYRLFVYARCHVALCTVLCAHGIMNCAVQR